MIEGLRRLARRAAAAEGDRRYDALHAQEARAARARIEAQHPEARLDAATHRRARDYAGDVLGSTRFAPWLHAYAAWRRGFAEGWIPDNYFGRVVLRALPGTKGRGGLGTAKTLARRVLGTDLLPDRASFVNGAWLDVRGEPIGEAEAVAAIFADGKEAVLKFDGSNRGRDVVKVRRTEFRPADWRGRGSFVAQAFVRQGAFFDAFSTASLATVRVTTLKPAGAPAEFRGAYLRLGVGPSEVLTSASSIRLAILDRAGRLDATGALPDWTSVSAHPEGGPAFAGLQVPRFEAVVAEALALHDRLPHVFLVGWDFAVDVADRPWLLEWNGGHADIKFAEAATGPHFADQGWDRLLRAEPESGWPL